MKIARQMLRWETNSRVIANVQGHTKKPGGLSDLRTTDPHVRWTPRLIHPDDPLATFFPKGRNFEQDERLTPAIFMEATMNGLIYLVGLVVVILAVLSFFGLR
jgi:hypothetical protein